MLLLSDEADIFDSDFGSTDSGGDDDDDEDAGERQLEREAKQAQKVIVISSSVGNRI